MTFAVNTIAAVLLAAASTAAVAIDGPALYAQHCAKCHGKTGKADTWRGRLAFAENFTRATFQEGNDNDDILAAIDRGPGVMPSFAATLSLDERKALVQVLRSFGASPASAPSAHCCSAN